MLFCLGVSQMLILNISVFLPLYARIKHPSIDEMEVGIIIGSFTFACMGCYLVIGDSLERFGRRNAILFGTLLMTLATFAQAFTYYIESDNLFFYACIASRLIDGIGDAMLHTAIFSILTLNFPDEKDKYIGQAEGMIGMGMMVGPVVGSAIYATTNYFQTFVVFGTFEALALLLCIFYIPTDLDKNSFGDVELKDSLLIELAELQKILPDFSHGEKEPDVTFLMFVKTPRALFALLTCALEVVFIDFYQALLSLHLLSTFGSSEIQIGLIFAAPSLSYMISTQLVYRVLKVFPYRRLVMFGSLVLTVLALILAGPSYYLGLPNNLALLVSGLLLTGLTNAFAFIPVFSEAHEAMIEKYGLAEENEKLSDKTAAIYGIFYSLGSMLAPVFGGAFGSVFGYRRTCDLVALIAAAFATLFAVFNISEEWQQFMGKGKRVSEVHIKNTFGKTVSQDFTRIRERMCSD